MIRIVSTALAAADIELPIGDNVTKNNFFGYTCIGHLVSNIVSAAIQRMAKDIHAATGFADEEIMRGASRMLTAGIGTQDLQLAVETATNLARAYGMELEPAMQMVVQAYWGQQRAIKKVVPEMQELLKEGMRGTDVLKQLNDALGPQAQAQAETFAGQLRLLMI